MLNLNCIHLYLGIQPTEDTSSEETPMNRMEGVEENVERVETTENLKEAGLTDGTDDILDHVHTEENILVEPVGMELHAEFVDDQMITAFESPEELELMEKENVQNNINSDSPEDIENTISQNVSNQYSLGVTEIYPNNENQDSANYYTAENEFNNETMPSEDSTEATEFSETVEVEEEGEGAVDEKSPASSLLPEWFLLTIQVISLLHVVDCTSLLCGGSAGRGLPERRPRGAAGYYSRHFTVVKPYQ